jgi:hypothetical protein
MKLKINSALFNLKFFLYSFAIVIFFYILKSCSSETLETDSISQPVLLESNKFGYNFNNYKVVYDTVRKGDSFGEILENNQLFYPKSITLRKKLKLFLTLASSE